eukprot:4767723-Amphidinium_carterae.1
MGPRAVKWHCGQQCNGLIAFLDLFRYRLLFTQKDLAYRQCWLELTITGFSFNATLMLCVLECMGAVGKISNHIDSSHIALLLLFVGLLYGWHLSLASWSTCQDMLCWFERARSDILGGPQALQSIADLGILIVVARIEVAGAEIVRFPVLGQSIPKQRERL